MNILVDAAINVTTAFIGKAVVAIRIIIDVHGYSVTISDVCKSKV